MRFGLRLLLSVLTVVSCVLSQPQSALAAVPAQISAQELAQQAATREDRVDEFKFIRKTAEELGIRVWLFGGTASGYLHYVKWDLQREKGDQRFQADRFDYDFTNIYRSTQDLDIVADGPATQISKLAGALSVHYPHFLGSRTKWEVRSLREASGSPGQIGYKEALLNDFDFLNQDTDSNSTGMIELTRHGGDAVVRDLRDWEQTGINNFLKDSAEDKDTFYRSAKHFQTSRAKVGQNPEIFSVIRALTKAFQYELSFSGQDWKQMQEIITQFEPSAIKESETQRRLKDIGKKLFKNAVNLEYAWNVLEKAGLRAKLMGYDSANQVDSLAWWMSREPLRTKPVGQGQGSTAKQLGIDIIAHETNNFLAYESITRAHTGDANVFISRSSAAGETAAFGEGFYAQAGTVGARGTGLTIRFHLNAQAREGSDFVKAGPYLIVLNKAALKVIPESLNMTPLQYFQYLAEQGNIDPNDKGIFEKLKRRLSRDILNISQTDLEQIHQIVLQIAKKNSFHPLLMEWLSLPASQNYTDVIYELFKNEKPNSEILITLLRTSDWVNRADVQSELIRQDKTGRFSLQLVRSVLTDKNWRPNADVIRLLMEKKSEYQEIKITLIEFIFKQPYWLDHPEFVRELAESENGVVRHTLVTNVLSQPGWGTRHADILLALLSHSLAEGPMRDDTVAATISHLFYGNEEWPRHAEIIRACIEKGGARDLQALLTSVSYSKTGGLRETWDQHPEFLEQMITRGNQDIWNMLAQNFGYNVWYDRVDILRSLMKAGYGNYNRMEGFNILFKKHHWRNFPDLEQMFISGYGGQDWKLPQIFADDFNHPEVFQWMLEQDHGIIGNFRMDRALNEVFQNEPWRQNARLTALVQGINNGKLNAKNLRAALAQGRSLVSKPQPPVLRCGAVF